MAAFICQSRHMLSAKMLSRIHAGHGQKPSSVTDPFMMYSSSRHSRHSWSNVWPVRKPADEGTTSTTWNARSSFPWWMWTVVASFVLVLLDYLCYQTAEFGLRVLYGFLFQRLKVRWKLDSKVQDFDSRSFDVWTELPRSWWYFHIRTQERSCLRRMFSSLWPVTNNLWQGSNRTRAWKAWQPTERWKVLTFAEPQMSLEARMLLILCWTDCA